MEYPERIKHLFMAGLTDPASLSIVLGMTNADLQRVVDTGCTTAREERLLRALFEAYKMSATIVSAEFLRRQLLLQPEPTR